LTTTLFQIWHLAVLTLARCDFSQEFITHSDGLADGVNTCITSQTLDMAAHVLSDHRDDSSFSTGTRGTA
jgi:hypothetical protein